MAIRTFVNPSASGYQSPDSPTRVPMEVHRRLPGYEPTPLVEAPHLAELLAVGEVWVKDESSRLGLPSFKILGASWGAYRAVVERLGEDPGPWATVEELAGALASIRPAVLTAATDGNHGRAVARMARLLGLESRIFVPTGTAAPRIAAIESEGATVVVVEGTYEDAVARAGEQGRRSAVVVQDTAWDGHDDTARWSIEGYSTIFWEVDDVMEELGRGPPDLVAVQIGVGALAASVVRHFRRPAPAPRPRIVGVEPDRAACVLASMEAGRPVTIPGPHDSIMAGLNCGTPSPVAWPEVSAGIDLFLAVQDDMARRAVREMAWAGLVSGETGAAGLAGLISLLADGDADARASLGVTPETRVLLISTEGATDPESYRTIVGG